MGTLGGEITSLHKKEDKKIVALFLGDYLVSEGALEPPRPNRAQGP